MEKFLFRLLMAASGVMLFVWLLNQVGPFLESLKQVSHVLGR